jgi:3-hydroxyisobutyrate dehydrogenase-like beta-hydroxyacid dehydrogenase
MTRVVSTIGLLHPGVMGAAVGREARHGDVRVLWCRAGRSSATAERAAQAGLEAIDSLDVLAHQSQVILSICPPAAAESVAHELLATGYGGLYIDANAISPHRTRRIAAAVADAGAGYLDGAIIGAPPSPSSSARLYLSGDEGECRSVAGMFEGSAVEVVVLSLAIGAASALKTAFSTYRKSSRVLAAIAHAVARKYDVSEALVGEGQRMSRPLLAEPEFLSAMARRAWRWAPELEEAAQALAADGLPPELATAAATVLHRWDGHRDEDAIPVAEVLGALTQTDPGTSHFPRSEG